MNGAASEIFYLGRCHFSYCTFYRPLRAITVHRIPSISSNLEHPTAFTRRCKLPLPLVALILSGMRMSVQAELDTFFAHLAGQAQLLRTVSEQAFAQACAKLSFTAIPALKDWLFASA